jgi:DNA uptake protein ComE-like DNA-binding protein
LRQLRNHPYIGFYKAQAILEARKSKGVFTRLSELLDLEPFKDASWHKIQPYLALE